MGEIRDHEGPEPRAYEPPHLMRYGRIEDLTHGANHITTNVVDILSVQV